MSKHFTIPTSALVLALLTNAALAVPTGPGGIGDTGGNSSLRLWLRADAGAVADDGLGGDTTANHGNGIKRWEDQSGRGNHFSQAASANRPTYTAPAINGQPALTFVGSTPTFLTANHFMDFSQPTIFIVGHESGGTGMALSVGAHVSTTFPKIQLRWHANPNQYWSAFGDGTGQDVQTLPIAPSSTSVFHMNSYELVNDTLTMRFNGGSLATVTNSAYSNPVFNTGSVPHIGKDGNHGSYNLNGKISEMIIFDRPLTSVERLMVDNHLSSKYDIATAPATDKYQGDLAQNGDYDRDVFGIGNNGTSTLSTNQSAGLRLTANALNTGDFLLAGHKVEENSLVQEGQLLYAKRAWYLDPSGSFETTLTFDIDEAGLSEFGPSFSKLLYADTDGGSFTALALAPVISGNTISFVIPAGLLEAGYYTLGATVPEPSSALLLLGLTSLMLGRRRRSL